MEEVVSEVYELFEQEIKTRMFEFTCNISDKIKNITLNIDKDRIRQVLINLVSNALKFCNSSVSIDCFDMSHLRINEAEQISFIVWNKNTNSYFYTFL